MTLSSSSAPFAGDGAVAATMIGALLEELRETARAAGDPREVFLIETHISWVLMGPEVYKVKKPVRLPFLDFSTCSLRERACRNELRVNRRLAPRTYLDVVPIRSSEGRCSFGGEGATVDWAVRMRRLDDDGRADVLLGHDALERGHVDALARGLAEFHGGARTGQEITACGAPDRIERNVIENFEALRGADETLVPEDVVADVERWQLSFVRGRRELFEARMAHGAIRDGHGDLRLEHVFFEEGHGDFEIIDAIEFDDRYRFGDVAGDVAFLAMDLARLGRVDLAERLLATYAREANDFELYRLVDFYESYRACVRAKIALASARREGATALEVERARAESRRYLLLADTSRRRSLLEPVLVIVGGGIASGKSTLAARLGEILSAPVIDTDRTRKHMLGVSPTTPRAAGPWKGPYAPSFGRAVYEEMFRRADAVLASGRSVVLDASFRTAAIRAAARALAVTHNLRFRVVECVAPEESRRERLVVRRRTPNPSDATLEVFEAFASGWEPYVELCPTEHVKVDTDGPLEDSVAQAMRAIDGWPRGLVQ